MKERYEKMHEWENFWIGCDQWVIKHVGDGVYDLTMYEEVNYGEYKPHFIAKGTYKELRKIVEARYSEYLESLT
jgi:hypothetical protein